MNSKEALSTPKQCLKLIMDVLRKSCPPYDEISLLGKALRTLDNLVQKDEKYAWHDLRKNPDDLPEQAGYKVRICIEGITQFNEKQKNYSDAFVGYGDLSWHTCDHEMMRRASNICDNRIAESYTVIAWREIEPFEEGE